MIKPLAVRVDAGGSHGWGHLKRCLALAAAWQAAVTEAASGTGHAGPMPIFAGRADAAAVAAVQAAGARWVELPPAGPCTGDEAQAADAEAFLAASPERPALVLVDRYGLDAAWHAAVRAHGLRVAALRDESTPAACADLVIDVNPCDDAAAKHAPSLRLWPQAALAAGSRFALLDPAFRGAAPAPQQMPLRCIGIFVGSSDPADHSSWLLDLLRSEVGWMGDVQVASTGANPHLAALRERCAEARASLVVDQPHLLDFHRGCGLQIGAGGGASWERCRLGVPTLALIVADNQLQTVPALARAGVVRAVDVRGRSPAARSAVVAALKELIADDALRLALGAHGRTVVDGRGAERVAARLIALTALNDALTLRPLAAADAARLLDWRNDPGTRAASHDQAEVAPAVHRAWLSAVLADPHARLWIAEHRGEPVGTVRAQRRAAAQGGPGADAGAQPWTLSWTVAPAARGRGLGRAMVARAALSLDGALRAEVKADNAASAAVARAAGLRLVHQGPVLSFERA